MSQFRFAAAMLLTTFFSNASGILAQSGQKPVVLSVSVADVTKVVAGSEVLVEVVADITVEPDSKGKHWHIYPPREQHKGVESPTSIKAASDSAALTIGDVTWPATSIVRNASNEFQPVYEGRTVFKISVQIAADAKPSEHTLEIAFSYQTCASLCLPPKTENLSIVLNVLPASSGTPAAPTADEALSKSLVVTKTKGPMTATLKSVAAKPETPQTVTLELHVSVDPQPDTVGQHWHFYPRKEEHQGIEVPTSIEIKAPPGFEVGNVIWPPPGLVINAEGQPQAAYDGETIFAIPVKVSDGVPDGDYMIDVSLSYQVCASQCLIPTTLALTAVVSVAGGRPVSAPDAHATPSSTGKLESQARADGKDLPDVSRIETRSNVPARQTPATRDAGDFQTSLFGAQFGFSANSVFAVPLLLLFSLIGGFLLNLTPCVLPIIPIKIMGLTQSAAGDPHRAKMLGLAMGFGILAFWLAIGTAISFVSGFDSISSLFQRPVFGISVGLFIAIMGVGMLVDMSIQLPQAVHRINPKHDTLHGAFLFGVMTAVLSTPCTAPFMGSAAAWATKANNSALVLAVFAAIAVGMGWPYVLLSWFPKLVSKVPRTGPASVLVKQVMGLLMLAVASFFGGTGVLGLVKEYPYLGSVLHWWIATAFVGAMSVWMTLQTFRITHSAIKRIGYSLLSLVLFAGMVIWSNGETSDSWEATDLHESEAESMRAYVAQLEEAVRTGSGEQALRFRSPAWRDYDPEAFARVKAAGQIAIVHFTADW